MLFLSIMAIFHYSHYFPSNVGIFLDSLDYQKVIPCHYYWNAHFWGWFFSTLTMLPHLGLGLKVQRSKTGATGGRCNTPQLCQPPTFDCKTFFCKCVSSYTNLPLERRALRPVNSTLSRTPKDTVPAMLSPSQLCNCHSSVTWDVVWLHLLRALLHLRNFQLL